MKSTSSSRTEGPFFEDESYALRLWPPTTGVSASGDFGAEDEVGEADLLLSPLDLAGRGRRVVREDRQRVRSAQRSRVGIGKWHECRDCVADERGVLRGLDVPDGSEVAHARRVPHPVSVRA